MWGRIRVWGAGKGTSDGYGCNVTSAVVQILEWEYRGIYTS